MKLIKIQSDADMPHEIDMYVNAVFVKHIRTERGTLANSVKWEVRVAVDGGTFTVFSVADNPDYETSAKQRADEYLCRLVKFLSDGSPDGVFDPIV